MKNPKFILALVFFAVFIPVYFIVFIVSSALQILYGISTFIIRKLGDIGTNVAKWQAKR